MALTVQDKDGSLSVISEYAYSNVAGDAGRMLFPPGHMQGIIQSTNTATSASFSAGGCSDDTSAHNIIVSSAIVKHIDAAWSVGTNLGGLDTGTVSSSAWYYAYAIKRSDTGVVDTLFTSTFSSPTMPANYDFKRLVGVILTDATSTVTGFTANEISGGGIDCLWLDSQTDVNTGSQGTTPINYTLSVPTTFSVLANINIAGTDGSANVFVSFYSPDANGVTPASGTSQFRTQEAAVARPGNIMIRTDTSGQITIDAAEAMDNVTVNTVFFQWGRRE